MDSEMIKDYEDILREREENGNITLVIPSHVLVERGGETLRKINILAQEYEQALKNLKSYMRSVDGDVRWIKGD